MLVTRPEQDARLWVADLQAHGIPAQALPLIHIGPCQHPQAQAMLRAARRGLADYDAVMFVSGNAATYFFDVDSGSGSGSGSDSDSNLAPHLYSDPLQIFQQHSLRAWTPGPSTARVLCKLGMAPEHIDGPAPQAAQFDSEALWEQVAAQIGPRSRVLIVRGTTAGAALGDGHGRDWLAEQIRTAGGQVDFAVAYERGAPVFSTVQHALAQQAAQDGTLWLLSSSEALGHLRTALPAQDWHLARALATHQRIAAAARALGFGQVQESKPALAQVMASIKSLI